jgi:hypothetical protein
VAARVHRPTHDFLAGREALFDDRITAAHIVDGHADLLTDDIFCLDDGPRVLLVAQERHVRPDELAISDVVMAQSGEQAPPRPDVTSMRDTGPDSAPIGAGSHHRSTRAGIGVFRP